MRAWRLNHPGARSSGLPDYFTDYNSDQSTPGSDVPYAAQVPTAPVLREDPLLRVDPGELRKRRPPRHRHVTNARVREQEPRVGYEVPEVDRVPDEAIRPGGDDAPVGRHDPEAPPENDFSVKLEPRPEKLQCKPRGVGNQRSRPSGAP